MSGKPQRQATRSPLTWSYVAELEESRHHNDVLQDDNNRQKKQLEDYGKKMQKIRSIEGMLKDITV